jgi:secondary thiamine-phosphate synthase enzyme
MIAVEPTFIYRHTRVTIITERPSEFIDVTDGLESLVTDAGMSTGLVNVQSLHTTAAIVVNEHEPRLLRDLAATLESVAPAGAAYQHDTAAAATGAGFERPNGHAHCQSLVLGVSACLNVVDGRLLLGRWQRVFLVELDGPRPRDLAVVMVGGGRR